MALTATSKNQLNAILSLLSYKDPDTCAVLAQAAQRLLDSTNKARVLAIIPIDGQAQTPQPTQVTALATLIADIAAN